MLDEIAHCVYGVGEDVALNATTLTQRTNQTLFPIPAQLFGVANGADRYTNIHTTSMAPASMPSALSFELLGKCSVGT